MRLKFFPTEELIFIIELV